MTSLALLLIAAPAAHAQDASPGASPAATPSPFCAVLTTDEVSAALGVDVTVSDSSDTDCTYQSAFDSGTFAMLNARVEDGSTTQLKEFFTDYTDITVADHTAIVAPDGSLLYVDIDSGLFTLQLIAGTEGTDQSAAIQGLAAAALPRLAEIPLPSPEPEPTDFPMPSFTGDADLAALFPKELGGETLQVQTLSGADMTAFGDADSITMLTDELTKIGKTIDDVSVGIGFSSAGSINALRIRGTDMTTLAQDLMSLLNSDMDDPQQSSATIGGKQVIKVTDGPEADATDVRYLYPRADVLWEVRAEEPGLSEAFAALP